MDARRVMAASAAGSDAETAPSHCLSVVVSTHARSSPSRLTSDRAHSVNRSGTHLAKCRYRYRFRVSSIDYRVSVAELPSWSYNLFRQIDIWKFAVRQTLQSIARVIAASGGWKNGTRTESQFVFQHPHTAEMAVLGVHAGRGRHLPQCLSPGKKLKFYMQIAAFWGTLSQKMRKCKIPQIPHISIPGCIACTQHEVTMKTEQLASRPGLGQDAGRMGQNETSWQKWDVWQR